jgi:hypothetical protein
MIKFKPQYLNDTTRRYPRTLQEAFPSNPTWGQDKPLLADRVVIYLGCFVAGYLTALIAMGY